MSVTDSIPVVHEYNFNEHETVFVGESVNLTVEYSQNVLTFLWYRVHASLPAGSRSSIINYSINGRNYSSLILSNLTTDDWGMYVFTASNHCGTSSVNVTLDIKSGEGYSMYNTIMYVQPLLKDLSCKGHYIEPPSVSEVLNATLPLKMDITGPQTCIYTF